MSNIDTFACQETIFCFTKIFILATKVCIKKIRKWSVFILAVMHALTAGCPVRSCPGRLLDQHLWIIKSAALTMSMGPLCGVLGVVCVKIKAPPSPPWSLGPMLPWCMSRGWVSNNIFLSLDAAHTAHAFKELTQSQSPLLWSQVVFQNEQNYWPQALNREQMWESSWRLEEESEIM